jgi:hypothetical protein
METILIILGAIRNWRVSISIAVSIALALILTNWLPFFTAKNCISLVILGITFGVYWLSRRRLGLTLLTKVEEPKISKPVKFLGLSFIGFMWGGFFALQLNSSILGAIGLILSVFAVGFWYNSIPSRHVSTESLLFSTVSLLSGYSGLLILTGGYGRVF